LAEYPAQSDESQTQIRPRWHQDVVVASYSYHLKE